MDEARRVLRRLDRIEELDRSRAPAPELLSELRSLVAEAEAWARREHVSPPSLGRCRERLEREEAPSED